MKSALSILCLFLFLLTQIYSQEKFDTRTTKPFYLDIKKETYDRKQKIAFKELIVKDYRFDTTKIGYILDGIIHKKIVFENNSSYKLTEIANKYFKDNFVNSSQNSLVIFIKSLWVQNAALDFLPGDKIRTSVKDESGACTAEFDIFNLNNGNYTPLFRIKDDFFYRPYTAQEIINFLMLPFDSLIKKISSMNIENLISNKKTYEWKYLDSTYTNRYDLPILKDAEYKKGVFPDFESFKQNKILYPEFIFKQSELTDEVYISTNSGTELLTEYWGFFDGKDLYIKIGLNCFKLYKQNNTWDLFGDKYLSVIHGGVRYRSIEIKTRKTKMIYHPLQLNMETGKVY